MFITKNNRSSWKLKAVYLPPPQPSAAGPGAALVLICGISCTYCNVAAEMLVHTLTSEGLQEELKRQRDLFKVTPDCCRDAGVHLDQQNSPGRT